MASRAKKKRLQQKELLADRGLREKSKKGMTLSLYVKIKVGLLVLLPIVYFICSPLLIFVAAGFIVMFIFAFKTEQRENSSVMKANRLSILKLDAALALIVICVAGFSLASTIFSQTEASYMMEFSSSDVEDDDRLADIKSRMFWNQVRRNAVDFMSLSTGERNAFNFLTREAGGGGNFSFTNGEVAGDARPPEGGGGGRGKLEVSDLPIDYLTETILSTVNTVLVWGIFASGIVGLILIYNKRYKLKKEEERGAVDYVGSNLSDEAIERLIAFGSESDEYYDSCDDEQAETAAEAQTPQE